MKKTIYKNSKNNYNVNNPKEYFQDLLKKLNTLTDIRVKNQILEDYIKYNKLNDIKNDERSLLCKVINNLDTNDISEKKKNVIKEIYSEFETGLINERKYTFPVSKYEILISTYTIDKGYRHQIKMDFDFKETLYNIFNIAKSSADINENFISKIEVEYSGISITHKVDEVLTGMVFEKKITKADSILEIINQTNRSYS
jgi:hypothetical protein